MQRAVKMMPKISVVTVCYNSEEVIEETILSVVNQTYSNIEYIIIDGFSTDRTVSVIKKYEDKIDYWVSEPDYGIYNAMNKGIKKATGDFINFMNAGDVFYSNSVISNVVSLIKEDSSIVYGDTMCVYSMGEKLVKPTSIDSIRNRLCFNHQSCFAKTVCMKNNMYDESFRLCADYKFFYDEYMLGLKFQYIPLIIARYDAHNGVSSKQYPLMLKEYGRIHGKSDSLIWRMLLFCKICFFKLKVSLKSFVPNVVLKKKNGIK